MAALVPEIVDTAAYAKDKLHGLWLNFFSTTNITQNKEKTIRCFQGQHAAKNKLLYTPSNVELKEVFFNY
jgi:hypothetical protein